MKIKNFLLILFCLLSRDVRPNVPTQQDLLLFDLQHYEETNKAFISLSDVDQLSDEPNQEAIPPFADEEPDSARKYEYIKLTGVYRQRFLARTKISEKDKLFIYDYAKGVLKSFSIEKVDVVARLNNYGGTWPYQNQDYMIGFEVGMEQLDGFGSVYDALAFAGKENPFVAGKMKHIVWKEMDSTEFPQKPFGPAVLEHLGSYNLTPERFTTRAAYRYEEDGMVFFLQDWDRIEFDWGDARLLIVLSAKTKELIYVGFYMDSEGTGLAPLDNQWTGYLFKGKPPVVFGFLYHSFGCPSVEFLSLTEPALYINCDNRH